METLVKLSEQQAKRVKSEIADCKLKLNKELNYSDDLQNKSRITELKNHINKLNNILQNGWSGGL